MAKTPRGSRTRAGKSRGPARRRAGRTPDLIEAPNDHEARLDGCDLEFTESEATPDSELPASKGGVELPETRRRRRGR